MKRLVLPEHLDHLPPDDPAALASRRDIRLYNRLMGNFRWISQALREVAGPGGLIELGAGDGALGRYLLRRGSIRDGQVYTGVDLVGPPADWPASWSWIRTDLRQLPFETMEGTLVGNFILHHFEDPDLRAIGRGISASGLSALVFNETARRRLPMVLAWCSRMLGVHPVTLHDARVSLQAGFRGEELADRLELDRRSWQVHAHETLGGANRLICRRRA